MKTSQNGWDSETKTATIPDVVVGAGPKGVDVFFWLGEEAEADLADVERGTQSSFDFGGTQ